MAQPMRVQERSVRNVWRYGSTAVTSRPESGIAIVQAHKAMALSVAAGGLLRITRLPGNQVAGVWALCAVDPAEHLSVQCSRLRLGRKELRLGDTMVSNHRRAMATLVEDTSCRGYAHLLAACDRHRHGRYGHHGPDGCEDRYYAAIGGGVVSSIRTPCPLYFFGHDLLDDERDASSQASEPKPEPYVLLRAEVDLLFRVSAYPNAVARIDGSFRHSQGLALQTYGAQHQDDALFKSDHAVADPANS